MKTTNAILIDADFSHDTLQKMAPLSQPPDGILCYKFAQLATQCTVVCIKKKKRQSYIDSATHYFHIGPPMRQQITGS